jgi:hypothetical protein
MTAVTRAQFRRAIHAGLRAAPRLAQDVRNALIRHAETATETAVRDFDIDGCHCPISAVKSFDAVSLSNADLTAPIWQFIRAFDEAMERALGATADGGQRVGIKT